MVDQFTDADQNPLTTNIAGSAAPTDGPSGTGAGVCGPGSLYARAIVPAQLYQNQGTKDSPAWVLVETGGGAPSGPAGGDLAGTYPNPTIESPLGSPIVFDDAVAAPQIQGEDGGAFGTQLTLAGGNGTTQGGAGLLRGGDGVGANTDGGQAFLLGGTGSGTSAGGRARLIGGDAGATGAGGDVELQAGNSNAANQGGRVVLQAGQGGPTGSGGRIDLLAGDAGGANNPGGPILLKAGGAIGNSAGGGLIAEGGYGDTGDGGVVQLAGGEAGGTGTGGVASLTGGVGGASDGTGGSALIAGGAGGATDGDGGDAVIRGGAASGCGTAGIAKIGATNTSRVELGFAVIETATGGARAVAFTDTAVNLSLTASHDTVNVSAAGKTLTLPSGAATGRIYRLVSSAGTSSIDPGAGTIDGAGGVDAVLLLAAYSHTQLVHVGGDAWLVIG